MQTPLETARLVRLAERYGTPLWIYDAEVVRERIRQLRPGLPVLFLSGYPAGTISLEALPQSGVGYLQKPFSRTGLLRKVREVLDG